MNKNTNKIEVIINYNNLAENYLKLREKTEQGQYCIPVVKSNAYSFGSFEVIETLLNLSEPQKKYFVFTLQEAIDIRQYFGNRIEDIYVLGGITSRIEINAFLKYELTPVISSKEQFILWNETAKKYDKNLNTVIKFNTGMNRSGNVVNGDDFLSFINEINKSKLRIEMIMSHFAFAEQPEHPVTQQQIKNFNRISKQFPEAKRCFCASDAIFTIPQCNFEASRPGYFMYGLAGEYLYPEFGFKQVLESIKATVQKNNNEYYVSIGLEDGLFSSFKKGSYVLVDGKEVFYKEIKKDRIILNTKDNIEGKVALINGCDKKYNKHTFIFDFFDTANQEICVRLLPSLKNKPEKFDLKTIGNIYKPDSNNKYDNSIFNRSLTVFKNNELYYFETTVLEIIKVEEDGWIGYGATKEVKKGDFFANIFNGYSDIFPRFLSNKNCFVFIENVDGNLIKCEIYGRISMDQISVKIPVGEENKILSNCKVILFDKSKNIDCFTDFMKKTGVKKEEIEYLIKINKRTTVVNL